MTYEAWGPAPAADTDAMTSQCLCPPAGTIAGLELVAHVEECLVGTLDRLAELETLAATGRPIAPGELIVYRL